jgi:hypothetical protein
VRINSVNDSRQADIYDIDLAIFAADHCKSCTRRKHGSQAVARCDAVDACSSDWVPELGAAIAATEEKLVVV